MGTWRGWVSCQGVAEDLLDLPINLFEVPKGHNIWFTWSNGVPVQQIHCRYVPCIARVIALTTTLPAPFVETLWPFLVSLPQNLVWGAPVLPRCPGMSVILSLQSCQRFAPSAYIFTASWDFSQLYKLLLHTLQNETLGQNDIFCAYKFDPSRDSWPEVKVSWLKLLPIFIV